MENDILSGNDQNKIVLTDATTSPYLSTLLPSPTMYSNGTINEEIIILVSIEDFQGAITNVTQTVKVTSIINQLAGGLTITNFL